MHRQKLSEKVLSEILKNSWWDRSGDGIEAVVTALRASREPQVNGLWSRKAEAMEWSR